MCVFVALYKRRRMERKIGFVRANGEIESNHIRTVKEMEKREKKRNELNTILKKEYKNMKRVNERE